jgi:hypothetical protein
MYFVCYLHTKHSIDTMKYSKIKIGIYEISAISIILLATSLRFVLIAQRWPLTNSDEGTIGIMALHIAYHGDHPVFYYGQNYMGALEAYLAAALFHLFGPSLFVLRLGLLLMFVLFLISMYLLTSMVYSKSLGLVTLSLLGLGSSYVMARELSAIGGYPETLLFGSLVFLCAAWLVLSNHSGALWRGRRWCLVVYVAWGIFAGLGLWSDLLIAPFLLMSALLIVCFCWRELLRGIALLGMIVGFAAGAFPLFYYNFDGAVGGNSLEIFSQLSNSGSSKLVHTWPVILAELKGTVLISIPAMTGNPYCPVTEVPFLGPNSPHTPQCQLVHAAWGLGYVLLFALALLLTLLVLRRAWLARSIDLDAPRRIRRYSIGLALLLSALLSIWFYASSAAPVNWPGIHARYLIGLLIAAPAVIWPLWSAITSKLDASDQESRRVPLGWFLRRYLSLALLGIIGILFVIATGRALNELPSTRAVNGQMDALVSDLVQLHVTHIYADYWTCDKIAFVSNEQITCAVVDGNLKPSHNRYAPYYAQVHSDPNAAYAYPIDSSYLAAHSGDPSESAETKILDTGVKYRRIVIDGYVIFLRE